MRAREFIIEDTRSQYQYHGTFKPVTLFKPFTHFGTISAAMDRLEDLEDGSSSTAWNKKKVYQVKLNIKNPAKLQKDIFDNHTLKDYISELVNSDIITQDEASTITTPTQFIKLLRNKDYDGLVYKNEWEDPGSLSYVILDPSQVEIVDVMDLGKKDSYDKMVKLRKASPSKRRFWYETKQGVAEGLSWKSLDAGLSLDNKMAIFEEYHLKAIEKISGRQSVAEEAGSVTFAGKDPNEFQSPKGGKPVMVLVTAQGSRYLITSDGMVLRHKSFHANTGGEDAGLQAWSDKIEFYDLSKPLPLAGDGRPLSFPDAVIALIGKGRIGLTKDAVGKRVALILDNSQWRPATIADAMPKAAAAKPEWAKIVIKADADAWGMQPKLGWQPLDYNQRGDGTLSRVHNGSPVTHGSKVTQVVAEGTGNVNTVTFFRGEPILSPDRLQQLKSSIGGPYPIYRKSGSPANIGTYITNQKTARGYITQALAGQGKGGAVTEIQVDPNSFLDGDGGIDEAVIITNIAGLVSDKEPDDNDPLRIQDRKQAMLKYLGPGVKKYLNDPLLSDPRLVKRWYDPEFAQNTWKTIKSGQQAVSQPGQNQTVERMKTMLGPLAEKIRRDPEIIDHFIKHAGHDWVEYNLRMNSDGSGTRVVDVKYYPPTKQGVAEGSEKLSYIGNCTDDDVIEHLFGDATGFAQAVDEYGDEFTLDDLVVKYDPETDVHSFYYKKQGVAEGKGNNKISFKVQKGKNKFATTLSINNKPAGVYQYDANSGRSIAEVYPKYKGKGFGKILILHAIYTAAKLGMDFVEDESRTAEYDNVLDSLSSNGYIVDDDGYWYVTGEGEQFLKQRLKQSVAEGLNESAIFLNNKTVIIGQDHGQPLDLSPDILKRVKAIASEYGAWYEGNGDDRKFTKGVIDNYVGSFDDEVAKDASPNDPKWLYVLFANVDANNRVQKVGVDPNDTIFNRLLANAKDNSFQGIGFTSQALKKFLSMCSEGKYDFVKMSQEPATEENLTRFLKAGESLMWPPNWEQYPNRAGKIAKAATVDTRDQYLASRQSGAYVVGSGHLKAIEKISSRQSVAEAFDKPYKGKWEHGDESHDMLVKLPDGSDLSIMFNLDYGNYGDEEWTVEFWRNDSQEITGEGDQQRIFATVLNAIQKFIKKQKPERIRFSANKDVDPRQKSMSRTNLYNRLVQRYANGWGYNVDIDDFADATVYNLHTMYEGVAEGELKLPSRENTKAKEWINKVYSKLQPHPFNSGEYLMVFSSEEFAVIKLSPSKYGKEGDVVYIDWFQAYPLGKGIGKKAMQELQKMAAEDGISLSLHTWSKGKISEKSLKKFYKSLGFQQDAGRMLWHPEGKKSEN